MRQTHEPAFGRRLHRPAAASSAAVRHDRRSASSVHIVRGESAILALQPLLTRFSEACGQPGIMQDLPYFIQKPGLLRRVPYLYLVTRAPVERQEDLSPENLLGSLLLLEYRIFGLKTRCFASNDRSGRGTLLAAPPDRIRVASTTCEMLLGRGANIIMVSFVAEDLPEGEGAVEKPFFRRLRSRGRSILWAMRRRSTPAYLQLHATLDETLAGMGGKTRSNMRYYRRRAERELGCTPVENVTASVEEIASFNDTCMYPVDRATVLWRLEVMQALSDPFLKGMKDREGRWLSIVAGRRFGETSEILWQMNRDGYPSQSLGTVMRSYCIEQEIARGARRLQVEGGTFHSMAHSFQLEEVIDLVVLRPQLRTLLRALVRRFIPSDNKLADMLKSEDLDWHEAGGRKVTPRKSVAT